MSEQTENAVLLYFVIFSFVPIGISIFLFYFFKRRYRQHHNGVRAPTDTPKKFKFLEELEKKSATWTSEDGFVVFQCRNSSTNGCIFRRCLPKNSAGIEYLNKVLKNHYGCHLGGEPKIQVPCGVVTVSIPKKNFRCRAECTDFVPRDGTEGSYSYQMLSGAMQATWFHVGEHKYLAGICLYLENRFNDWLFDDEQLSWALSSERPSIVPDPSKLKAKKMQKVWCRLRNQWVIVTRNQFGEVDKYVFNGRENRMEPVQCFDCHFELDDVAELIDDISDKDQLPSDCLNWLKVEFCERLQKPMMIGKSLNGEIVHFEWNKEISKFQLKSCEKCAISAKNLFSDNSDDEPPNYEHLEMIDMMVERAPTIIEESAP